MKTFILFMMLLSIMSCSTDSQNEDDVNYLSSYSDNEDGNIDENNDDSYNDNQNQNSDNSDEFENTNENTDQNSDHSDNDNQQGNSENNSVNNENIEKTFTVSVQRQGYYGSYKFYVDNQLTSELVLKRGLIYVFDLTSSSTNYHPFYIGTSQGGGNYNDEYLKGVTNSRVTSGKLTFKVPVNSPSSLYFNCGFHYGMGGHLIIQ